MSAGSIVINRFGVWLDTGRGDRQPIVGPGVIVGSPHGVDYVPGARARVAETGHTVVEIGEMPEGVANRFGATPAPGEPDERYRRWVYPPGIRGASVVDYVARPTVGRVYVLRWPS